MPNVNKVLRGWERCKSCSMSPIENSDSYLNCEYTIGLYCGKDKLIAETIELLKEQQEDIKTLSAFARADGIDVDVLLGRKVNQDE